MTAMLSTPALIHHAQTAAEQPIEGMERLLPVPEVLLALQDLRDAARVLRLDPALLNGQADRNAKGASLTGTQKFQYVVRCLN